MSARASPTPRRGPALPSLPFAVLAALEHAAGALARLDKVLEGHTLSPAWLYRARLEAVRRDAAADGQLIDPWHLAAMIEGVRFRTSGQSILERALVFDAARHAFALYSWRAHPDEGRQQEITRAAVHLKEAAEPHSPLVGVALAVHAWLDAGGERAPIRAALASYWVNRGIARLALPFAGAAALSGEACWELPAWMGEFLDALAVEAEAGLYLLRILERDWASARQAVKSRRRGSYATPAIDILAAGPVVSATRLAAALGIAPKNAARLLEGFVRLGIAIEVTHRSRRRLYGLPHLAPVRDAAMPPDRWLPTKRAPSRPAGYASAATDAEVKPDAPSAVSLSPSLPRFGLEPDARVFTGLDRWVALTDQAIRRAQRTIEQT